MKSKTEKRGQGLLWLGWAAFFVCLLSISPQLQSADPTIRGKGADETDNLASGIPGPADVIVNRVGYALGYDEKHEQAAWVVYRLTKKEVLRDVTDRTDDFRPDPLITTGSAGLSDYKYSGFDRGHLVPAGDMDWSRRAMSESFYLSNMTPQRPGFNRAIWRKLEAVVRNWAVENDVLFVVTGPVLKGKLDKDIGPNDVTVPKLYYKVLLDYKKPEIKAIGFILPNKKCKKPLVAYACAVDVVEKRAGLDFFFGAP